MIRITKANCNKFQRQLGYAYESGKNRAESHSEYFKQCEKVVQEYPHYTSEKEALQAARNLVESSGGAQVWSKVGKDEEFYYIDDYFVVTDDLDIARCAEYIGMAQLEMF